MVPLCWREEEFRVPGVPGHLVARDGLALEPGVGGDLVDVQPLVGVDLETATDQALHLLAELQLGEPGEVGLGDLSVALEGDVAADHVVEEDSQGPDGQTLWSVGPGVDPLWGGVDSSALELSVDPVLKETAGAEVDQLDLEVVQVDQDVLVLDVPVDDALLVAGDQGGQQLPEDVLGHGLRQGTLFADEVEQVLAVESLHHNVEAGLHVKVVNEPDHPRNVLQLLH